ncbi:MAG TPA: hypothetical protein VGF44_04720 [Terriglobales bacterium]
MIRTGTALELCAKLLLPNKEKQTMPEKQTTTGKQTITGKKITRKKCTNERPLRAGKIPDMKNKPAGL